MNVAEFVMHVLLGISIGGITSGLFFKRLAIKTNNERGLKLAKFNTIAGSVLLITLGIITYIKH